MIEVPVVACDVRERLPARDAGVGDEGVEPTEPLDRLGDEPLVPAGLRHVGGHERTATAERLDLRHAPAGLLVVPDVVDRDVEAALGECERDAAADAAVARRAGDERDGQLDHHPQLAVVGHAHLVRAQPDVVERDALPGRDVELERVPRARDDLVLPDPGELPVRVRPESIVPETAPCAQRPALVRAEVRDRVHGRRGC